MRRRIFETLVKAESEVYRPDGETIREVTGGKYLKFEIVQKSAADSANPTSQ